MEQRQRHMHLVIVKVRCMGRTKNMNKVAKDHEAFGHGKCPFIKLSPAAWL